MEANQFWIESGMSKALLQQQISNSRCVSSPQYLESCRQAVVEARKVIPKLHLNKDDFDGVLEEIDHLTGLDVPKEVIFGNMFNAHLQVFDAHAMLGPSKAFEYFMGATDNAHFGLGILAVATGAGLTVHALVPGSGGARAGLQVHDRILAANEKDIGVGLIAFKNRELFAGKPGTPIKMKVDRDGEILYITAKIGVVQEANVQAQVLRANGERYGYIRVRVFKASACAQVKDKVRAMRKQVRGFVLDLRDNPGGKITEGVCIAGAFLGPQRIVGEKPLPGPLVPMDVGSLVAPFALPDTVTWLSSTESAVVESLPVTVLIDALSASASEIVAGALQDYKRAWIVGDRSFGKGSVQDVRDYPNAKGFKIILTSALFYRPNGETNQLAGVTPDFNVPFHFGAEGLELEVPREAEQFPGTIRPSAPAKHFIQSRVDAERIQSCVEARGLDLRILNQLKKSTRVEDYQKAYGLAVLECSSVQHNSSRLSSN